MIIARVVTYICHIIYDHSIIRQAVIVCDMPLQDSFCFPQTHHINGELYIELSTTSQLAGNKIIINLEAEISGRRCLFSISGHCPTECLRNIYRSAAMCGIRESCVRIY